MAAPEEIGRQVSVNAKVGENVLRPAVSDHRLNDIWFVRDLLPANTAVELRAVGAVEHPALLLPPGEARGSANNLLEHIQRDVGGRSINGGELGVKIISRAAVGNAPRAEELHFFDSVSGAGVRVPARLITALALILRKNDGSSSQRVGVIPKGRQHVADASSHASADQ